MARRANRLSRFFSSSFDSAVEPAPEAEQARIAVGRVVRVPDYAQIMRASSELATMMFGADLAHAPDQWRRALAYGVVTGQLAALKTPEDSSEPNQSVVALMPGWGLGVARKIPARYLLIETRALTEGAWAGVLEPGSEHLFQELLSLISYARSHYITPILLENAVLEPKAAESFSMSDSLTQLRRAVPASLAETGAQDPLTPAPSPLMTILYNYQLTQGKEGR